MPGSQRNVHWFDNIKGLWIGYYPEALKITLKLGTKDYNIEEHFSREEIETLIKKLEKANTSLAYITH